MHGKKELLRRALSLTGCIRFRWKHLPPALYVFNYHRIGNVAECDYDGGLFSCTAERFRENLVLIKDRYKIVTLAQVEHLARNGTRAKEPLALITFDDGYLDNYTLAFPILREMEATAVFFLPTAFIGAQRLMWSDEIAWVLQNTRRGSVRLPYAQEEYSLEPERVRSTVRSVLRQVRRTPTPLAEQIEIIRQACGNWSQPPNETWPKFMNWQQAQEMSEAGMDIGSHTHSHRLLSRLCQNEQLKELTNSRALLEERLGARITAIAYPVGAAFAYTADTCGLARTAGYSIGFNFQGWINRFPFREALDMGRFSMDDRSRYSLQAMACFPGLFA